MNERDLVKLLSNLHGNQRLAVEEFLFLFAEIAAEGFTGRTEYAIEWTQGQVGDIDHIERRKILKAARSRRVRGRGLDN